MGNNVSSAFRNSSVFLNKYLGVFYFSVILLFFVIHLLLSSSLNPLIWWLLLLGENCIPLYLNRTVLFCCQVSIWRILPRSCCSKQAKILHCLTGQDDAVGRTLNEEKGDLGSGSHFPTDQPSSLACVLWWQQVFPRIPVEDVADIFLSCCVIRDFRLSHILQREKCRLRKEGNLPRLIRS